MSCANHKHNYRKEATRQKKRQDLNSRLRLQRSERAIRMQNPKVTADSEVSPAGWSKYLRFPAPAEIDFFKFAWIWISQFLSGRSYSQSYRTKKIKKHSIIFPIDGEHDILFSKILLVAYRVLEAKVVLARYFLPSRWILLKQLFLSPLWSLSR